MKKFTLGFFLFTAVLSAGAQITKTQVGRTTYDLQTNDATARRIALLPGGKVVTTATTSVNYTQDALDRGTGYNFFNGTAWNTTNFATFTRPENKRTGWPNPVVLPSGKEIIVSHVSDGGFNGLHMLSRPTAGTGAWTQTAITTGAETWPRMASKGDSIVVISSYYQTSFNDVSGGIMIMRSFDGGTTWTQPDTIEGVNSSYYTTLGGDAYSLDVKGNTIAIVTGARNLTLYKSTDFGNTFTKTDIVPTDNLDETSMDSTTRHDGTSAVLIDNNGKCHVWGGAITTYYSTALAGVYIDVYAQNGLLYWNENMPTAKPVVIPQTTLTNEPNSFRPIPYANLNETSDAGAQLDGYQNTYSGWVVSQPQAASDAQGNLYVVFTKIRPDNNVDTSAATKPTNRDAVGYNLNDVYVIRSLNGGATWLGPLNVSSTDSLESAFPSIARDVDGSVHILYQEDALCGSGIRTNANGTAGSGGHTGGVLIDNKIIYAKVDTAAIIAPLTDYTKPVLTRQVNVDTLYAYVGCPLDLSKKNLLKNYVTVFDNSLGGDSSLLVVNTNVNFNVAGIYNLSVTARDIQGNNSGSFGLVDAQGNIVRVISEDTINFVVKVTSNDVTPPVVSLIGDSVVYVKVGSSYTELGATAVDDNPCTTVSNYVVYGAGFSTSTLGQYTLTYSVTDGSGNAGTTTRRVVVSDTPVVDFKDTLIACNKERYINKTNPLYFVTSWYWNFGNNTSSTQQNPADVVYNTKGTFNVTLRGTNYFGTRSKTISVTPPCASIYNSAVDATIDMYPTLAQNSVTIELNEEYKDVNVKVYDVFGKNELAVETTNTSKSLVTLNTSKLVNGLYLVVIETEKGNSVKKLTIQK